MKVDLTKVVNDINGEPMSWNGGKGPQKATLKHVITSVLLNSPAENYKEKVRLAKRIVSHDEDVIDIPAEDVAMVKGLVKNPGGGANAQFVYQFEQTIDPGADADEATPPKKDKQKAN